MNYQPTKEQEQALREWLQESIIPLIEQVLIKKIGQALKFAEQEIIVPKREWQGLTDEDYEAMAEKYVTNCYFDTLKYARAIEAKLRGKNNA